MRAGQRTKIVATIGPASANETTLRALMTAGLDVVRLNFSHGGTEQHTANVAQVRKLDAELGTNTAILADLQGPKIRTGPLPGGPFLIERGSRVTMSSTLRAGDATNIPVRYPAFEHELSPGSMVLLGDGEVELRAEKVSADGVLFTVVEGGPVKENQGINAAGLGRSAPSITEKDLADARVALDLGVDYIGLSFVRTARDVKQLKGIISANERDTPVVAKIEKQEALDVLDEIIAETDGVMVARGDLGLELPMEKVPLAQKRIIRRANEQGKLVITATQMLESMIEHSRPTRAEVSDVANAILDGTDAVMLSGETSVGKYPELAVRAMARIAGEMDRSGVADAHPPAVFDNDGAMARAACRLAREVRATAVVVFTRTGFSARLVSNERPPAPIFAFTPEPAIARRLAPWWGVSPIVAPWPRDASEMLRITDTALREGSLVEPGATVVVARWATAAAGDWTNFVHLHVVGEH